MAVSNFDSAVLHSNPSSSRSNALAAPRPHGHKPVALVVLLENVGYIAGLNIPPWLMTLIDFVTEEYAKLLLRLLGAQSRYDRVIILEDEHATANHLEKALQRASQTHRVDLLLLVHGQPQRLVGYKGETFLDASFFKALLAAYRENPHLLDLRMVYGVNCYGASLAPLWLALGAEAVNGAVGVNWLPEPSLSLFLWKWLRGASYVEAVAHSFRWAKRLGKLLWPDRPGRGEDPHMVGSQQIVMGRQDIRLSQ